MRKLNSLDFDRMEETAEESFLDECSLISNAVSYESTYGDEVLTPTVTSGVACGFQNGKSSDKTKQNLFQTEVDAILRLPVDTTISGVDQIQMTKLNQSTISPVTYDVTGEPQIGKTCIVVGLKSVE